MSISGNQYADKVFSEHPIALWPLDENAFYLSLIDDNDRLFSNWTLTNLTSNNNPTLPPSPLPFLSETVSSVISNTTSAVVVEAVSPNLFSSADINSNIKTFCVNFFLYQKPDFINWFKIGYRYNDGLGNPQEVISSEILAPSNESWLNFNKTYEIPLSWSGSIKIFIQASFSNSSGGDETSRTLIMNGLSVGQNSETTCYESLGSQKITIPESVGISGVYGVVADQYGILSDNSYYIVRNNELLSKNDGFPMVYGTHQSTKIYPSGVNIPSFVFPGKGMLNEAGRNNNYTLEMWIKLNPSTAIAKKIIGPVSTDDGVYVKEGFISLAIGGVIQSHCVSEWYRPMLMHLSIKDNNITMFINGEIVINMPYNKKTIDLPNERDWWGIYSYSEISVFYVDCVSIYPYSVPEEVAKRRFIYGQGTPSIQSIDSGFFGTPITIDFSTAEYGSNVIYPDIYRWDAGYFNNLNANRDYISVPQYSLPEINLGGRNIDEWYKDNNTVNNSEYPEGNHPKFVTFRPNQGTRTNLIPNPSFETNTTGWDASGVGGSITRSTSQAKFGAASAARAYTASGIGYIQTSTLTGFSVGQTVTATAWVKSSTSRNARVIINWYNSTNGFVGQTAGPSSATSTTTWQIRNVTSTAPATADRLIVFLEVNGNNGDTHYWDNVMLERTNQLLPYFDGSYADPNAKAISTSWSGIQNLSTSSMLYWTPEGSNWTEQCYLNFPSLNVLNNIPSAIYGVFEAEQDISEDRTLISLVNITTTEHFDIYINSDTVYYSLNGDILHQEIIQIGTEFLVGINFESLGSTFGYGVSKFLSSPSSIQVYVGGNGLNTFEGKIYSVSFSNQTDFEKISNNFETNGIAKSENYEIIIDHISSYSLIPEYEYGLMFLDISISSEWEEYFPLSYFAGYVLNSEGELVYDLDMLQINIGYSFVETQGVWDYLELKNQYSGFNYSNLQPPTYANYFNLYKNNTTGDTINFSKSSLQPYLTFQSLESGANAPISSFAYTKGLSPESVIYADEENTTLLPEKVYETKFAFKDNTIVYPPKSKNFEDYCMVVHLSLTQRSILKNPLKIKSLEITSKNLNHVSSPNKSLQKNNIGTKFGLNIYPQKTISGEIDYKSNNPVFIYKTSTPYLYTTKKSGIQIATTTQSVPAPPEEYMTSIPVNQNGSYDFQLGAIQFFAKGSFNNEEENIKLLDIKHKDGKISVVLEKNVYGNIIKAYNNDGTSLMPTPEVLFYQNGRYVVSPKIINDEWNAIGMSFVNQLDFSEYNDGSIDIFGGMVFNNLSYYLSKGLGIKTDIETRTWENVLNYESVTRTWSFWDLEAETWRDVYVLGQSSSYINSPADIYNSYTGTNKNIIDDGYGIRFNKKDSSVYSGVLWQTITSKPV